MTSRFSRFKAVMVGRPLASHMAEHQLLPKRLALPVFASDALSSVAYATEEAMIVLALAGVAAFSFITPVSLAVATLLGVVVVSYRQTIRAYPQGGGAFSVATDNFGIGAGAVAASSLMVDYVLTVAVSVSAGVAAITSAVPSDQWLVIAMFFVVLLTVVNLRGRGLDRVCRSDLPVHPHSFGDARNRTRCLFDSCPTRPPPSSRSSGAEFGHRVPRAACLRFGASALTGVRPWQRGRNRGPGAQRRHPGSGHVAISMFAGSTLAAHGVASPTRPSTSTARCSLESGGQCSRRGGLLDVAGVLR